MKIPLKEAIEKGGMVGDGAMGSVLYERGVFVNRNFDEVNLSQPELIYKIHREYLKAGAHVLETNSYGANRIRLSRHGLGDKTESINRAAARTTIHAAQNAAYVLGSMGPSGLNAGEVRRGEDAIFDAYLEQATILVEEGVDGLIIETFGSPQELRIATRAARAATKLPIISQIAVATAGGISDGTAAVQLAREIQEWGADIVGANCHGPDVVFDVVVEMVESGIPICAFPNAGAPKSVEDRLIYLATPENFGVFARRMYKAGVKMVGGCCGTNPEHIRRVAAAARMVSPHTASAAIVIEDAIELSKPVERSQRSEFGAKLGKKFVISVEVNPGNGLATDKQVAAAKMLIDSGADIINIADGPRATVRMSNIALAHTLQNELGIETLLHVCCRDRNLLGLQSSMLGAHVMGLRNLICITGDPPKVGDYPDATAVYDVDSIGLLKILHGFNQKVDPVGKATADQTHFVLGTGVEPGALDFERELMRLRQKAEAGAEFVMTQPIYDPEHLDRFLDASKDLDLAVLVGIVPLASYRNAQFLHNNIPGMSIPEDIRARMKAAGTGEEARAMGIEIAIESLLGVRDRVCGAYIMPPLGRYDMAAKIIQALGDDRSIAEGVPGKI